MVNDAAESTPATHQPAPRSTKRIPAINVAVTAAELDPGALASWDADAASPPSAAVQQPAAIPAVDLLVAPPILPCSYVFLMAEAMIEHGYESRPFTTAVHYGYL